MVFFIYLLFFFSFSRPLSFPSFPNEKRFRPSRRTLLLHWGIGCRRDGRFLFPTFWMPRKTVNEVITPNRHGFVDFPEIIPMTSPGVFVDFRRIREVQVSRRLPSCWAPELTPCRTNCGAPLRQPQHTTVRLSVSLAFFSLDFNDVNDGVGVIQQR